MMNQNQVERELGGAFQDAHSVAITELGFGMPVLLQMTAESGPTDAARRILPRPTEMFTQLLLRGRLDLSVEAIVLREQFRTLFTEDELRPARDRLRESNYPVDDDSSEREAWGRSARRARQGWARESPY